MKKNVFVLREFPLQIASLSNGERDFIPKLRHCVDGGNFYPISRMHVFKSLSDTFPSDVFCTKKKKPRADLPALGLPVILVEETCKDQKMLKRQ